MHLRAFTDDMRWMLKAYQWRKREAGSTRSGCAGRWSSPSGSSCSNAPMAASRALGGSERARCMSVTQLELQRHAFLVTLSQSEKRPVIERFVDAAARAGEFCW